MRVTTAGMRKAVRGWLEEEEATQEQTLQLLDALYGGAIRGNSYHGGRSYDDAVLEPVLASGPTGSLRVGEEWRDEDNTCHCLLGTLEQIASRRTGTILGATEEAFALALKLRLGDTPENSEWAAAAARGIEDYYAAKGWR